NGINTFTSVRTLSCDDIGTKVFKVGSRSNRTSGIVTEIYSTGNFGGAGRFIDNLDPPSLFSILTPKIEAVQSDTLTTDQAQQIINEHISLFKFKDEVMPLSPHDQLKRLILCAIDKGFKNNPAVAKPL